MALADELRARIEREGPIPVRDFMEAALTAYYGSGPEIGAEGDFYTASNVSLFPHALARFVKGALPRAGDLARIVELGGGRGDLAENLGFDLTIVEPMAGLAQKQEARGLQVASSLAALRVRPTVFIANELLDALPVHRVHMTDDGPMEGYVAWKDEKFVEVMGPPSPVLAGQTWSHLEPGDATEVCMEIGALLDAMAAVAPRAIALFLDYAAGPPRPGGTLRGFSKHQVTDALANPGTQDVTADVDFAHVARVATARGWDILGARRQGEFLADLGLVEDMMSALGRGDHEAYAAGKSLLMPTAMGERFEVLCLGRGVAKDPPLPGFRPDLYPGASRR